MVLTRRQQAERIEERIRRVLAQKLGFPGADDVEFEDPADLVLAGLATALSGAYEQLVKRFGPEAAPAFDQFFENAMEIALQEE